MSDRSLAASTPTPEDRDKVTAKLCDHFAAGHLELDALEQRLAAVDEAGSAAELAKLTGDLPVLATVQPLAVEPPAGTGWALAFMGGSTRKGMWAPPRRLNAFAVMGGVELDFRDARLPAGETRVNAVAVMGGIEIVVPPGLRVTVRGLPILGAVDQQADQVTDERNPNAPHLKVTALACMGGVEIKTRPSERAEGTESQRER
jgi:hypothetical protein